MDPKSILKSIVKLRGEGTISKPVRVEIGSLIKQFRKGLGLTPTIMAGRLKVSSQSIHRWEKGDVIPRHPTLFGFKQLLVPESLELGRTEVAWNKSDPQLLVVEIRLSGTLERLLAKLLA